MRGSLVLRRIRLVLVLVPFSTAVAQIGPPPPPPPLGPPPQPPGNPVTAARANLGKALFWDEQLSSTRTVACGSCHQARVGGTDPRSVAGSARATHPGPDGVRGTGDDVTGSPGVPLSAAGGWYEWSVAFGIGEQVTGRLANSHINAAYAPSLFWDGRARPTFVDPATGDTVLLNGGALES
jgi:cytochrome c peroxidase